MKRLLLFCLPLCAAEPPPMPPLPGRQYPYLSTIDVRVTNTVTTIYDYTYARFDRMRMDGSNVVHRTNFMLIDTNILSRVETNTPCVPQ